MDSRTKIVNLDDAKALLAESVVVVTGYFDPLVSAHAERLASLGAPLLVLVGEGSEALLSLRARAELVAALRAVKAVVAVEGPLDGALATLGVTEAVREESADEVRRTELIEHIRRRYAAQVK